MVLKCNEIVNRSNQRRTDTVLEVDRTDMSFRFQSLADGITVSIQKFSRRRGGGRSEVRKLSEKSPFRYKMLLELAEKGKRPGF